MEYRIVVVVVVVVAGQRANALAPQGSLLYVCVCVHCVFRALILGLVECAQQPTSTRGCKRICSDIHEEVYVCMLYGGLANARVLCRRRGHGISRNGEAEEEWQNRIDAISRFDTAAWPLQKEPLQKSMGPLQLKLNEVFC